MVIAGKCSLNFKNFWNTKKLIANYVSHVNVNLSLANQVSSAIVFKIMDAQLITHFCVSESPTDDNSSAYLLCVQCKDSFQNAWDLMVHAQAAHMLNIYELGVPRLNNCSSPSSSPRNTPDKVSKL